MDAEIGHIESEVIRLSSRLHHLRTSRGFETQLDPVHAVAKAQPRARREAGRLSLGPMDIVAATPRSSSNTKAPLPAGS